jgi:prepilin-type N-terminal cleavage/methylation domain-containing protein
MKVLSRKRGGFTLVELAVVVVIIGVLAAFGVPRFLQSVERSKASESFAYLSAVRSAQERYHAREGTYASTLTDLDIQSPKPKYFEVPAECSPGAGGLETGWTLTLTRQGPSAGYGSYTVVYTDQGFDTSSTIVPDISPVAKPAS